jgi:hypothetical protein
MCAILGYYSAPSGNPLPTFRDNLSVPFSRVKKAKQKKLETSWSLKMGPMGCPKMSVKDYHSTLRNIREEHRSQSYISYLLSKRLQFGWEQVNICFVIHIEIWQPSRHTYLHVQKLVWCFRRACRCRNLSTNPFRSGVYSIFLSEVLRHNTAWFKSRCVRVCVSYVSQNTSLSLTFKYYYMKVVTSKDFVFWSQYCHWYPSVTVATTVE